MLQVLPDPVPGEDGHHKSLDDLLGRETDESQRSSLQKTPKRRKTLPLSASIQHVKNVDLMLQCDQCAMWTILYSKVKLKKKERTDLQVAIEDISFTCGAPLQDFQLPGRLAEVYTREFLCGELMDKLYYTAEYSPICIYCADTVDLPVPVPCLSGQTRDCEVIELLVMYYILSFLYFWSVLFLNF